MKEVGYIVGLRPWTASGPGWSNFGLNVLVRSQTGEIEDNCIQGRDLSDRALDLHRAILALYGMLEHEAERMKAGKRMP